MSLLNMTLLCFSCRVWDILTQSLILPGLGDPFFLSSDYSTSSSPCSYVESNVATLQSHVANIFKRRHIYSLLPIHCLTLYRSPRSYSFIPLYSLFHVDDEGFIMALLRRVTSCRLQLIIQEDDLETPF